ncbi:MAG: hypothetical protein ACTSRI_07770 [Promethearchaeota archaeon]
MGHLKKKKYVFNEEEKLLIRELKNHLSITGVPREEWSSFIQQELNLQKRTKRPLTSFKNKSNSFGFFRRFSKKIENIFQKILSKRFNFNNKAFEEMFKGENSDIFSDNMNLIDSFIFDLSDNKKIEDLGKHGTFIKERPDKKRKIVHFDDDDDENNDLN